MEKETKQPKCPSCRFRGHDTNNHNEVIVVCRKHAPTKLHGVGTGYESERWPIITLHDWCGEHEPGEK